MAVNLHRYPAVLLEKDDKTMKLVVCEKSNRIIMSDNAPMFLYKNYGEVMNRLIAAGWKVKERWASVNMQ